MNLPKILYPAFGLQILSKIIWQLGKYVYLDRKERVGKSEELRKGIRAKAHIVHWSQHPLVCEVLA